LKARDAYRRMKKHLQLEPDKADAQQRDDGHLSIDWNGFAATAKLNSEEIEFFQEQTGSWDAKRIHRVRSRVYARRRRQRIKVALRQHVVWVSDKNLVNLKTYNNPAGAFVHKALLGLFQD